MKLFLSLIFCSITVFAAIPDFTKGDKIPADSNHDWTLGPTGARGWIYSNKLETSEARQVYVTKVDQGSPADGALEEGDVILGVAGKSFSYDPRVEIGKAVGKAEAADGKLTLKVWRQGKTFNRVLQLKVFGSYGLQAPFNCSKSKMIFEQGCEALARQMKANGRKGNWISRSFNALVLLSSGKAEYLPLVKATVKEAAMYSDPMRKQYHSWFYGPINILLAEYIMATGDRSFMPLLKRMTMDIVAGQTVVGSWGHKFIPDSGRLGGYGMMNAPGVPLVISLVLARKAGVKDPKLDEAIKKSVALLRFYVGKGSIPYGDHNPRMTTHDDNGKNGSAAILFNLLDDFEAATFFSHMCVASFGSEKEMGHTGNFFNMLYALPGVALSGPHATGAWMQEFGWYYDLARRWDGSWIHQGPPEKKKDSYRNWDSTGAYLLAYAQAKKKLYMTGKKDDLVKKLSFAEATRVMDAGRDWTPRLRLAAFAKRSVEQLIADLSSWSPILRDRIATELASRKNVPIDKLIAMLSAKKLETRLGACQVLINLRGKSAAAVPALRKALRSEDLWLRVKAAEALSAIGAPAKEAIPYLLELMVQSNPGKDPRNMQQRYLSHALFRGALLGRSLDGVDKKALCAAVAAGLTNEDGHARGALRSVYKNLDYEEIKPLLGAIRQAIIEPSPSGIMFGEEIRLAGLKLFAKHHISEGIELNLSYMLNNKRHGSNARVAQALKYLESYGAHAKRVLPELEKVALHFEGGEAQKPNKNSLLKGQMVRDSAKRIAQATNKPQLVNMTN